MTKKLIGGTLLALSALITGGQQAQGANGNGQEYYDADYTVVDDDDDNK